MQIFGLFFSVKSMHRGIVSCLFFFSSSKYPTEFTSEQNPIKVQKENM